MQWAEPSLDGLLLAAGQPEEVRTTTAMSRCVRAACSLPRTGVSSWSLRVESIGEEAQAWVEAGVALAAGDDSEGNTLIARYQGGGDIGPRSCGVVPVGAALCFELDMDQGTFTVLPPSGSSVVWRDAEEALFTGVGKIRGHSWTPFCRVRAGRHPAILRLEGFEHAVSQEEALGGATTMRKQHLQSLDELKALCEKLDSRGGLGPDIGDIQCVLAPEDDRGALYLSGGFAANHKNFKALRIGAILRLGGFTYSVAEHMQVHSVNIGDNSEVQLIPHIADIVRFQDSNLCEGRNVLVHCGAGVSRAGSAVVAYLMWKRRMSYEEALAFVQKRRPWVRPNNGFATQLKEYNFAHLSL